MTVAIEQFVAVLLEEIRTDFKGLFSTDAVFNNKIRVKRKTATAREQRSPANIGNGGKNSKRQSPADTELRKWRWNTSEGRSVVPENFQSNRAFNLHLNRSIRSFCLNTKLSRLVLLRYASEEV